MSGPAWLHCSTFSGKEEKKNNIVLITSDGQAGWRAHWDANWLGVDSLVEKVK